MLRYYSSVVVLSLLFVAPIFGQEAKVERARSIWHYKAQRVYLPIHQSRTYWLIWAKKAKTAEQKYFISNASENESLENVLKVALVRWNIEHCFGVSKNELGFRHFEGRNYTALMRHLMLCQMMLTFVADQTLEGKKSPEFDDGASGSELQCLFSVGLGRLRCLCVLEYTSRIIHYYQRRNAAATQSRHRHKCGLPSSTHKTKKPKPKKKNTKKRSKNDHRSAVVLTKGD